MTGATSSSSSSTSSGSQVVAGSSSGSGARADSSSSSGGGSGAASSPIVLCWIAFGALGTGLIHIAVAVGTPPAIAAPLIILGAVEFGWALAVIAAGRILAPRAAIAGSIAPSLGWAVLTGSAAATGPAVLPFLPLAFLPLAIASLLGLVSGAVLAAGRRRQTDAGSRTDVASGPVAAGRYVLGLTAGALVVGALVTPALAGTEAGRRAQPHGQHVPVLVPEPGHPGH